MLKNLRLANALKLELLAGGYAKLDRRWFTKTCSHPFARLYYIYSGNAVLSCNGVDTSQDLHNLISPAVFYWLYFPAL